MCKCPSHFSQKYHAKGDKEFEPSGGAVVGGVDGQETIGFAGRLEGGAGDES